MVVTSTLAQYVGVVEALSDKAGQGDGGAGETVHWTLEW